MTGLPGDVDGRPAAQPGSTRAARIPAGIVVGAYAAVGADLDPAGERALLGAILEQPGVCGLEIPYLDGFHRNGDAWLLERLGSHAELVATLVTDAMRRLATTASFGLASLDADGRLAAIDVARRLRAAAARLAESAGRPVVRVVELQSAPASSTGSSTDAFTRSLSELVDWDWGGAELVVEHCDAARPGRNAAKGFLELEAEIDVVRRFGGHGSPIGIVINWGRSAIEGRNPGTPVDHVRAAQDAGVLRGIVFSGCSDQPRSRGGAWADVHLAPADRDDPSDPSLLNSAAMTTTMAAALDASHGREAPFIGLKVSCPPGSSTEARRVIVSGALERLQNAREAARASFSPV
jgi:hypothetical protein